MNTTTKKPAPLDYLQTDWSGFWSDMWAHDIWGIICFAFLVGFIAAVVCGRHISPNVKLSMLTLATVTGLFWVFTS